MIGRTTYTSPPVPYTRVQPHPQLQTYAPPPVENAKAMAKEILNVEPVVEKKKKKKYQRR